MNIIAFDLSLTETGYACSDGSFGTLEPPKHLGLGTRRLQWIRFHVLRLAAGADLVVLEGYAFGAENQAHQMGELGGVMRVALSDRNIRWIVAAPTALKKFATGRGNAKKNDVLGEAIRHLGYTGNNHNVADAMWLLTMARANYTQSGGGQLSKEKVETLAKIEWPVIAADQPELVNA